MWNQPNTGSTDILNAAQHRRTADLAEWFGRRKHQQAASSWRPLHRVALLPGLTFTVAAFVALISVSVVTHGKPQHFAPVASAPMPAVNVP